MGEIVELTERQRWYREVYLRSSHWRTLRALALEDAYHRCAVCNSGKDLDVHHRTYERLGEEFLTDLLVLCRTCHDIFHKNGRLASIEGGKPKSKPKPKRSLVPPPEFIVDTAIDGLALTGKTRRTYNALVLLGGSASSEAIAARARLTRGSALSRLDVLLRKELVNHDGKTAKQGRVWTVNN